MKTFFFLSTGLFLLMSVQSCMVSDCTGVSKEDLQRPELSEEYLEWVKVSDTAPRFKLSNLDILGNVSSTDTLYGHYTLAMDSSQFTVKNCDAIGYYKEATMGLVIKEKSGNVFTKYSFIMDNNKRKEGFTAFFSGFSDVSITEQTQLDSAVIGTTVYRDVFKLEYWELKRRIYYTKRGGFIFLSDREKFIELIP